MQINAKQIHLKIYFKIMFNHLICLYIAVLICVLLISVHSVPIEPFWATWVKPRSSPSLSLSKWMGAVKTTLRMLRVFFYSIKASQFSNFPSSTPRSSGEGHLISLNAHRGPSIEHRGGSLEELSGGDTDGSSTAPPRMHFRERWRRYARPDLSQPMTALHVWILF